jgi:hypothetical protein
MHLGKNLKNVYCKLLTISSPFLFSWILLPKIQLQIKYEGTWHMSKYGIMAILKEWTMLYVPLFRGLVSNIWVLSDQQPTKISRV